MTKLKFVLCGTTLAFVISCSSTQVGLKENWIDERDVIALAGTPVSKWMETAGRPTVVEISGDTSVYYYNYRPTMYATTIYEGSEAVKEVKPTLASVTEVWGSRKNVVQIKVLRDSVISAVVSDGPDKRVIIRGLNGDIVIDPNSGFNPNLSDEQKIDSGSEDFDKALKSVQGENTWTSKYSTIPATVPATVAPAAELAPAAQDSVATVPLDSVAAPIDSAVVAPVDSAAVPAVLDSVVAPVDSTVAAPVNP